MLHRTKRPVLPDGNLLLSLISNEESEFIRPYMEPASLPPGLVIADLAEPITHCFFPNNGMISLLTITDNGLACEVGFIGFEGMLGIAATLGKNQMPYQALVQAKTEGIRVPHGVIRELFKQHGKFHDIVLRLIFVLLQHFTQTSVCNHFHSIQERMCRWFATMCERSGDRHLTLTQEFLAHMLGVQRTSIAAIASTMQADGIISYSRGKIEVVDLEKLERCSCQCLSLMRAHFSDFIDDENNRRMSDTRQTRPLH